MGTRLNLHLHACKGFVLNEAHAIVQGFAFYGAPEWGRANGIAKFFYNTYEVRTIYLVYKSKVCFYVFKKQWKIPPRQVSDIWLLDFK